MQPPNHHPFLDQPRFADMSQGVLELERWVTDLLRQGLVFLAERSPDYWEFISKRMVDLKLPGLARSIVRIQQMVTSSAEIPFEAILREIADIGLLLKSFRHIHQLSPYLQREILLQMGWNVRKEELEPLPTVSDHWLVIGKSMGEEDKLRYRKTWYWPYHTSRPAMLLEFTWGNQPFPPAKETGQILDATMTFYPGSFPFRVQLNESKTSQLLQFKPQFGDSEIAAFLNRYTRAGTRNPWLIDFPVVLNQVLPIYCNGEFVLVDQQKNTLRLNMPDKHAWRLVALASGNPVSVFGEWDGQQFSTLTLINPNGCLPLDLSS